MSLKFCHPNDVKIEREDSVDQYTRGCVSRQTILALVFQVGQSAQKRWRRLRGFKHLADVIQEVKFENGVRADTGSSRAAA